MNKNIVKGFILVILSFTLSVVYLNCSGNSMEPLSEEAKGDLNSSGAGQTNSGTCQNGAVNNPDCTINAWGNCMYGGTPPDCNNTTGTNSCGNGATNPPTCTTLNGACVSGANNPPTCTTYNHCDNGALDYPKCTPPTAGVFNVLLYKYGPLSSMTIKIKMDFNSADATKKGAHFLFVQKNTPTADNPNKTTTYVCTNPCDDSHWKLWGEPDGVKTWDEIYRSTDWSMSGLKNQVGELGLHEIFSKTGDLTALGGYRVYAGYGLGNSVGEAIDEMLNYHSQYFTGRYIELFTIPTQAMSFSLGGPTGGSPGLLATYDLWGFIYPSSEDYGKKGYFFVYAHDLNLTVKKVYRVKPDNTFEWVDWDGKVASLGDKYFKADDAIKNEKFQVYKGDASLFVDWRVYVGYGIGNTPSEAATDFYNKGKYNVSNPFILK